MLAYDKILVDTDSCTVTYNGTIVTLRPKEYFLLKLFLKYPNRVLSYEEIIEELWDIEHTPTFSSIRSHIKGLRQAFKKANAAKKIVENVPGIGYRLSVIKKTNSEDSAITCPTSIFKRIMKSKAIEFLVIDEKFIIKSISQNLRNYCDYPDALKVGIYALDAFPEFIGLEESFNQVRNRKSEIFKINGIARNSNPDRPEFINFYVIADDSKDLARQREPLLFIVFEDASEQMIDKQGFVQRENNTFLLLGSVYKLLEDKGFA